MSKAAERIAELVTVGVETRRAAIARAVGPQISSEIPDLARNRGNAAQTPVIAGDVLNERAERPLSTEVTVADGTQPDVVKQKDAVISALQAAVLTVCSAMRAGSLSWSESRVIAGQLERALEVSVGHGHIMPARDPWDVP